MEDPKRLSMAIGNTHVAFAMDALRGRDHVVAQCLTSGLTYYELPLPTVLMALAQEAQGAFLDVGANTGLYSLLAAASNPTLYTVGFEPVPSVRALMERNLTGNPELSQRISVSPYALSNKPGKAIIYEHVNPMGLVPTSSTLESTFIPDIASIEVSVDVSTVDLWYASDEHNLNSGQERGVRNISFLKIDVEGHERSMFEGALNVFAGCRPIVIVELLGCADFGYFEYFLKHFNYIDVALFPGEAKHMSQPSFQKDAWNHVFCPAERAWSFACTCRRIGLPIG